MKFKEYITSKDRLNENRGFRGSFGGAFGKQGGDAFDFSKPYRPPSQDSVHSREQNKFQSIDQRVAFGKGIEGKIRDALQKEHGWKILPVSTSADKYDKIDGIWDNAGHKLPIQIKYRDADSKDDILAEVIKFWSPEMFKSGQLDFNGRDMMGKAKIYVVLDKSGNKLMVRNASELKEKAKEMVVELMKAYNRNGNRVLTQRDGSEVRITTDRADGNQKVMVYINPKAFSWKMDLPLAKSVWAA